MIAGRQLFFSGLFPDAITSREYHSTIFNSFMHFFFPGASTSLLCFVWGPCWSFWWFWSCLSSSWLALSQMVGVFLETLTLILSRQRNTKQFVFDSLPSGHSLGCNRFPPAQDAIVTHHQDDMTIFRIRNPYQPIPLRFWRFASWVIR